MSVASFDEQGVLQVDEIGLAYARVDDVVVKAGFRPVAALEGARTRLGAVIAGRRAWRHGGDVNLADMLARLTPARRVAVLGALDILPICTLAPADLDRHRIVIPPPDCDADDWPAFLARREAAALDMAPDAVLIHAFPFDRLAGDGRFEPSVSIGPRHGLALTGFCGRDVDLAAVMHLKPAVITFDKAWFARIRASEPARRLLRDLVDRLAAAGTSVMVGGIATEGGMKHALDHGARWLHGPYFGDEITAGIPFDLDRIERMRPGSGGAVVDIDRMRRRLQAR